MGKSILKRLGLIMLLLIVIAGLMGCANSKTTEKPGEQKVTLKFAMWDPVNPQYDFIKAFESENPNIKVDLIQIPVDNYSDKLNSMIAANSAPDVILAWECDINRFAKGKAIVPLDDYIKNTKAFAMEDFIPALSTLNKMNGAVYGLPWCYASELLYYNKDMFDKAGVAYPNEKWTWKDFEDAAKKLTISKDDKTVQWGADAITFPGVWYSLVGQAGDAVVDNNGKLALGEGAKRALQFESDLTNKAKVIPPPSANNNAVDLFSGGKAAMTRQGSWLMSSYRGIKNFKWDIAPLPKDTKAYASLHTGFFTIYNGSKNKDAAWKFIEFCMSDKGQALISKGLNNPSARKSVAAKGDYKVAGENGPANWAAMDQTADFVQIGYVLAPSGVTNYIVNKFNAVVLGQIDADTALKQGLDEAHKVMGN